MKLALQVALGIIVASVVLFVGRLLIVGMFVKAVTNDFQERSTSVVAQLNEQRRQRAANIDQSRTVTEVVKPKNIRECQTIYGQEINETIKTCMEGSVLTVRINSKTGEREILRREKYYHLEKQNVL